MTGRKSDNLLRGDRTPAYVGRETGAAELQISPSTWDDWLKDGVLPPPCNTFPEGTPRWRWEDVDAKLANRPRALTVEEQVELGERLGKAYKTKRKRRRFVE
jgi:hypothetical protein